MRRPEPDLDAVAKLVQEVAHGLVLPRFRDLSAGEISEKSPGDLVTAVDVEAERVLTARLADIAPGVPVVGEEAVAADASLLGLLGREGLAFVVDPIDGTRAFVEGDPDFAVMVALVDTGVPIASWIALPVYDELFTAARGAGAFVTRGSGEPERLLRADGAAVAGSALDGTALDGAGLDGAALGGSLLGGSARDGSARALRGGVATAFLPDVERERVGARVEALAPDVRGSERLWAGATYRRVLLGEDDFIVYWRTNPWDHAPGTVLVREAGGVVQRWDGADYRADDALTSLLVAATPGVSARVHSDVLS